MVTETEEKILLDSDILKVTEPFHLNQRRTRRIFWKPIKDEKGQVIDWIETKPLPADPYSIIYYMRKGFKIENPLTKKKDITLKETLIKCPYCDFVPKNAIGLRTHLNKHVAEIENKEE